VNAAGFNASSGHLRSGRVAASPLPACANSGLARRSYRQPQPTVGSNEHDYTHRRLQSIQGPSTLANRSSPGAAPLFTTQRAPCGAPAMRKRTDRSSPSQRRVRHGSQLWSLTWTSESPAPAPAHWSVTGKAQNQPRPTASTPRERTNPRKRARMPFAVRDPSVSIRNRNRPAWRAHARLARASYHPGTDANR
jgi:hypothetical protein